MARVGIVTDSTCDLNLQELESLGVTMVPLKVLFGDESFRDWVDLKPNEFYAKLATAPVLPKTSQPSPAEFAEAYAALAAQGCDSIVSIHLSGPLSGTVESATMAANGAAIPVHVVDTREVSHAVGMVVHEACSARDAGSSGEEVAERARAVAGSMRMLFVLDTLEYLVKGGRAGKATGLAASILNIKPVLLINEDGIIEPFKKVKGRKKALAELAQHVAEEAGRLGRLKVGFLHACNEQYAQELRADIEATGADVEFVSSGLIGAVIGTYAGPDAVGCAFFPADR